MRSAVGVGTGTDRGRSKAEVQHSGAVEHGRIIETDGARHAVTELGGVLDVVDAGDGVMAAHQERVVVAWIAIPRSRESRRRLTEGETSELDEHHFNRDVTFARTVEQAGGGANRGRAGEQGRVDRAVALGGELEVTLTEGADHAVFRGSAGINRQ